MFLFAASREVGSEIFSTSFPMFLQMPLRTSPYISDLRLEKFGAACNKRSQGS